MEGLGGAEGGSSHIAYLCRLFSGAVCVCDGSHAGLVVGSASLCLGEEGPSQRLVS